MHTCGGGTSHAGRVLIAVGWSSYAACDAFAKSDKAAELAKRQNELKINLVERIVFASHHGAEDLLPNWIGGLDLVQLVRSYPKDTADGFDRINKGAAEEWEKAMGKKAVGGWRVHVCPVPEDDWARDTEKGIIRCPGDNQFVHLTGWPKSMFAMSHARPGDNTVSLMGMYWERPSFQQMLDDPSQFFSVEGWQILD